MHLLGLVEDVSDVEFVGDLSRLLLPGLEKLYLRKSLKKDIAINNITHIIDHQTHLLSSSPTFRSRYPSSSCK